VRLFPEATLHIAREEPSNSFHYERLGGIDAPNIPNLIEIGYLPDKEKFVGIGKTERKNSIGSNLLASIFSKTF